MFKVSPSCRLLTTTKPSWSITARAVGYSPSNFTNVEDLTIPHRDTPTPIPFQPTPLDFKNSALENGVRVTTVTTDSPVSTVGIVVKAGPRFETTNQIGASHFLKHLAYQRTQTRSPISVVRDMEILADFSTATSREHVFYLAKTLRHNVSSVVDQLHDILSPKFHEYIVKDLYPIIEAESLQAEEDVTTTFVETLHSEAYRHLGLGRSLYCPSNNVRNITHELLEDYMKKQYQSSNIAFIGVGVEHEEFKSQLNKLFANEQKSEVTTTQQPAKYLGGDVRIPGNHNTHFAVVFKGLPEFDKDAPALAVLTALVGGDSKYSKDGPGRGVTTRLFRNVLDKADFVNATATFNVSYSDSGLWGVYLEAERGNAEKAAGLLTSELANLKTPPSEGEVAGARQRAKASFLTGLEQSASFWRFTGRQLMNTGAATGPAQFSALLDKVTPADVARVAKGVLSSDVTLVGSGDVEGLPLAKDVQKQVQ